MQQAPEIIEHWIETIEIEGINLTKWEKDFVDSVANQWKMKKWISDKQEEVLERIYANKTP